MTAVAIDWENDAARVAVAERRPAGAEVVRAVRLDGVGDVGALAAALRTALPDVRWSRAKMVATVGGDRAAFRLLKLPPTPDNELADMVGLLAEKEFGAGDAGVVDYVPLAGDAESPRTVLATRVRQSVLDRFASLAEELDSTAERVVVRACGVASVAARLDPSVESVDCLLAGASGDAGDLIALADGVPAIVRSTRGALTTGSSDVRRTLSTLSLQLGRKVERFVALGEGSNALAVGLPGAKQLLAADADLLDTMPGVVGAALDLAEKTPPRFDLLNPRQSTSDNPDRRRQLVLAGVAAAAVLLGVLQGYLTLSRYDRERESLEAEIAAAKERTAVFEPNAEQAAAIKEWLATDVNWLDEMEHLSRELRPQLLSDKEFAAEDDVMLLGLTATAASGSTGVGGQVSLDAVARDADTPTEIELRLANDRREVEQGGLDQTGKRPYVWHFKPTLKVTSSPTAAGAETQPDPAPSPAEGEG